MKNEARRKKTTQQLLEATKRLLEMKSCHAITLKDIMDESELSKGAIFHYVKSKDEIFAWVLQERLEETNVQFLAEVEQGEGDPTFEDPMQQIANRLHLLEDADDITNKILMYLLDKDEDPVIKDILNDFYERSVYLSKQWITTGQEHGVIKESIELEKTAELFVLLAMGLRVRTALTSNRTLFTAEDLTKFISITLKEQ